MLHSRLQDSELEVDAVWEALKAEEDFTSSCGTIDADISLVTLGKIALGLCIMKRI